MVFASLASGWSATIPYNISFTDTGADMFTAITGTVTGGASSWSQDTGLGTLTNTLNVNTGVSTAATQISNAANQSFTIETTFSFSALNAGGTASSIGFGAFASSSNFLATNPNQYLLVDWAFSGSSNTSNTMSTDRVGRLRVINLAQGVSTPTQSVFNVVDPTLTDPATTPYLYAALLDTTYVMRLTITNVGPNLYDVTAGVYKDNVLLGTTAGITNYTPVAEPVGGYYFGLRDRNSGPNTNTVVYTDFSVVAVPEPNTTALLFLSSLGIVFCLRWRRMAG